MNEHLKLSEAGQNLIKHFESRMKQVGPNAYKAYACPAGVSTIGWGTTRWQGKPIPASLVWTGDQCDTAFIHDMAEYEGDVKRLVTVMLDQFEYDALVSFTYNCGAHALAKSTLLRKVNAGDFEGAALEFQRWNKANGKVLPGLVRRRASEALLFQNLPDENYDGVADDIQPLGDPMPQHVDEPT
jgi:lysozyme